MKKFKVMALVSLPLLLAPLIWGCGVSTIPDDYHPGIGIPTLSLSTDQGRTVFTYPVEVFTLTNRGTDTAKRLSGSALSSPFSYYIGTRGGQSRFPGTGGTCTDELEPGESCTIVLSYYPGGGGTHQMNFSIIYYSGDIPRPRTATFSVLADSNIEPEI